MQNKGNSDRPAVTFGVNDEVAYAGRTMRYGRVVRVLGAGDTAQIEIEFEDGSREVHKMKDRALSLLRRAGGRTAAQEEAPTREPTRDYEIDSVRRSDQRRR